MSLGKKPRVGRHQPEKKGNAKRWEKHPGPLCLVREGGGKAQGSSEQPQILYQSLLHKCHINKEGGAGAMASSPWWPGQQSPAALSGVETLQGVFALSTPSIIPRALKQNNSLVSSEQSISRTDNLYTGSVYPADPL